MDSKMEPSNCATLLPLGMVGSCGSSRVLPRCASRVLWQRQSCSIREVRWLGCWALRAPMQQRTNQVFGHSLRQLECCM